jgi:hypothetical protein
MTTQRGGNTNWNKPLAELPPEITLPDGSTIPIYWEFGEELDDGFGGTIEILIPVPYDINAFKTLGGLADMLMSYTVKRDALGNQSFLSGEEATRFGITGDTIYKGSAYTALTNEMQKRGIPASEDSDALLSRHVSGLIPGNPLDEEAIFGHVQKMQQYPAYAAELRKLGWLPQLSEQQSQIATARDEQLGKAWAGGFQNQPTFTNELEQQKWLANMTKPDYEKYKPQFDKGVYNPLAPSYENQMETQMANIAIKSHESANQRIAAIEAGAPMSYTDQDTLNQQAELERQKKAQWDALRRKAEAAANQPVRMRKTVM